MIRAHRKWVEVAAELRREATAESLYTLPNPFRAGDPLRPDFGHAVYRGRDELVRDIEDLLVDPSQKLSISLLGPRRCGKSSFLRMLPDKLPDVVPVFFDLQDNPIDSPRGFFEALARETCKQSRRNRRVDLPTLPEGSPFESAGAWLKAIDEAAGDRRVLICIDEFERLEDVFPGSRRELLQLMGLFRATIQHRRNVRLLISGAAPFDELSDIWYDHFISVRELHIGFLDHENAIDLLTNPVPAFPPGAISGEVAERIWERTAGQPYLLQLYGSLLVNRLNQEQLLNANLEIMDSVEEEVIDKAAGPYFRDLYYRAPDEAKAALESLANKREPNLDDQTRRWLRRRLLLTSDNKLNVPVFGRWLREDLTA